MHTVLDRVVIDPPAAVIAERQRLGLDRFDEVWDGEYHMVPGPSSEHHRIERDLILALYQTVRATGLDLLHEMNLLVSEEIGFGDFRIPDLSIFRADQDAGVGLVGAIALVAEIRSPGDESLKKLPYYERLGVGEVLIIDRDTKAVRHWALLNQRLVESPGDPAGHHQLACIPVTLHADHGVLVVMTPDGTTRI